MKNWVKYLAMGLILPSLLIIGCSSKGSSTGAGGNTAGNAGGDTKQPPATAVAKDRTLRLGIGTKQNHPLGMAVDKYAELIKTKSGGKIKIQNFYDTTLGDEKKMMEALQGGIQDITVISSSPVVGTVKELGILDYPFLFNNEKEADTVLDGPMGQKLLGYLPQYNLIGLGFWENGFRNVTNNKRPITTADDFKGLKFRTQQNAVHLEVFKALGANPIPLPWSEVFTSLESKAIDGQENPVQIIDVNKLDEVQKYLSITRHVYTPYIFLVSKKLWDQLSAEEKKIFEESAKEAGKFQRETIRASTQQTIDDLKKRGMAYNEVTPEATAKMQEIVKPVLAQFSSKIGDDLVKQFMEEINKARAAK